MIRVYLVVLARQNFDGELGVAVAAIVGFRRVALAVSGVPGGDRFVALPQKVVAHGIAGLGVPEFDREVLSGMPVVEVPVVEDLPLVINPDLRLDADPVGVVVQHSSGDAGLARWRPELWGTQVQRGLVHHVRSLAAVVGMVVDDVQQRLPGVHAYDLVLLVLHGTEREVHLQRVLVLPDP